MDLKAKFDQFEHFNQQAEVGGGIERIEKQHSSGKKTARERIEMLLDPGTFHEIDKMVTHKATDFGIDKQKIPGDGVVSGYGKIDGRLPHPHHRCHRTQPRTHPPVDRPAGGG